jgi:hypothetical protein
MAQLAVAPCVVRAAQHFEIQRVEEQIWPLTITDPVMNDEVVSTSAPLTDFLLGNPPVSEGAVGATAISLGREPLLAPGCLIATPRAEPAAGEEDTVGQELEKASASFAGDEESRCRTASTVASQRA